MPHSRRSLPEHPNGFFHACEKFGRTGHHRAEVLRVWFAGDEEPSSRACLLLHTLSLADVRASLDRCRGSSRCASFICRVAFSRDARDQLVEFEDAIAAASALRTLRSTMSIPSRSSASSRCTSQPTAPRDQDCWQAARSMTKAGHARPSVGAKRRRRPDESTPAFSVGRYGPITNDREEAKHGAKQPQIRDSIRMPMTQSPRPY